MRMIGVAAVPLLLSVGSVVQAQMKPSSHEEHQAAGQHQPKAGEEGCGQMMQEMHEMHKMMSEMMKMHQGEGMAAHSGQDATKDKPKDQPKR